MSFDFGRCPCGGGEYRQQEVEVNLHARLLKLEGIIQGCVPRVEGASISSTPSGESKPSCAMRLSTPSPIKVIGPRIRAEVFHKAIEIRATGMMLASPGKSSYEITPTRGNSPARTALTATRA